MSDGKIMFVRVRVTGPQMENSYVPSVPVSEVSIDGKVLVNGYAHPDALVSPQEIRMKLLEAKGGS